MEEKKELKQEIISEDYKKELEQKIAAENKLHKKIITKMNKRFFLLILALIVLGIGLYVVFRETGIINKYVYEEVDNLAEREGVCFDNLLFSYYMGIYCGNLGEERWLCIMNNGDVYIFKWSDPMSSWDIYYSGLDEYHSKGYDETNWGKMENVVYLGRFSDRAVGFLNNYVNNYNINAEYYYLNPPQLSQPQGGGGQQVDNYMDAKDEGNEEVEWRFYGAKLYWCDPPENYIVINKDAFIEGSYMNQTWWGGYEKEIQERSLDENAIAAIELFESSGFYDRWVKMCLNGY